MADADTPILSICIPSYNRAALLGELLTSAGDQLSGDLANQIEVVVSDNASVDDTPAVVAAHRASIPRLVSIRHPENMGPDRNFMAAVENASGRHCWLMGDDDLLEPGSLARMVQLLHQHDDLCGISVDRYARSYNLQTRRSENVFSSFEQTTILRGADTIFSRLSDYLGYLSAQIFRRDLWVEVVAACPVERFYNAYVHTYIFAEMVKREPSWMVLKERLVTWRSGNDFFMAEGRFRRLKIDVEGFDQIARACFGEDSETFRQMRDTAATRNLRTHVTAARLEGHWNPAMRRQTIELAMQYYARSPKFWLVTAPFLFAPTAALPLLRRAQRVVHRRRARRLGFSA